MRCDLLVVVPTYNEAENMQPLVQRIEASRRQLTFDVLVVDDSSPDGTPDVVRRLQGTRPWLHLLQRPRPGGPAGLGSAYREGFSWGVARGYHAFGEMDADLS
ncbi:MAG: glycosyltransferase, partial [Actinomycetota bacterium]